MKYFLTILLASAALRAAAQGTVPQRTAAQNPSLLKLCGSVGFAQPLQSAGGFLLALEPKYRLTPTIDIGVLVEAAYLMRSIKSGGSLYTTSSAGFVSSYRATGNYWLSKKRFQSFVGIGAGVYQLPAMSRITVVYNQSPDDVLFPAGGRFGGMVRYGLKTGHYVATIEYNAVLPSPLHRSATPINSPNSYVSLKVGYEIGGFGK